MNVSLLLLFIYLAGNGEGILEHRHFGFLLSSPPQLQETSALHSSVTSASKISDL